VEGDTDVRLFKRMVDQSSCFVQGCNGRANVIQIVTILDAGEFVGHLGIIDKDFGGMLNENIASDNIVVTDENDIELMIYSSDVFERFVAEYCNQERVTAFENQKGGTLKDILLQKSAAIGTLRYLSRREGWNLDFDGMRYRFTERRDVEIDLERQIEHLRGRSQGTTMPLLDIVRQQMTATNAQHPILSCVCGHDVCEVVSKVIHDVCGRADLALSRGGLAIEEVFRTAYTRGNLATSNLFASIRAWEVGRAPFRVF
jgi:hypothetical protein